MMQIEITSDFETQEGDPILDLVSILEAQGYKLVGNGVRFKTVESQRFLLFETPES